MLTLLQSIEGHRGKGWSVAWNPTGDKIASSGEDKTASVWCLNRSDDSSKSSEKEIPCSSSSPKVGRGTWVFSSKFGDENHQRSIRDIAWSPCGKYVLLASFDAQVTLWEAKGNGSFECVSVVEGHENEVKSVAWSPSGKYFASSGRDKNVMIW